MIPSPPSPSSPSPLFSQFLSSSRARTFIYNTLLPHFCQFCPPLIFPTLLRADSSPRRLFSAPSLAQPSLPLPYPLPSLPSPHPHPSLPSPHPFDPCPKEKSERFVRKHPFKTVTCALQTARQTLRNPPQKQKNADFLNFFESKSCTVQKVAVLLHSLTEKTGVPVSSERQQKFFEKIP